jgi:hypothetical protein
VKTALVQGVLHGADGDVDAGSGQMGRRRSWRIGEVGVMDQPGRLTGTVSPS